MKAFLIILLVVAIAVFTGTWIFDGLSWILVALSKICDFMAKVFNLFGWNNGII